MADFHVVPGTAVSEILADSRAAVLDRVRATYLEHDESLSVNPDSYFLRFPDKPNARVIALPAYLGGAVNTIGRVDSSKMRAKVWSLTHLPMRA
ncbi:MAG: hypothetical protein M3Q39_15135 [Actinomycetota bacterium]|nr:hypothetical protein [Actinomycetota bacterium]